MEQKIVPFVVFDFWTSGSGGWIITKATLKPRRY